MAAAPKAADAPAAAPNGKKKLILMIGVGLALVAISVGGTIAALKMMGPENKNTEAAAVVEVKAAPAIYLEMSPNFTINFSVKGRQRFLQATISLLYRDPALEPLIKLHMPAIRNGLVMMLSSKNFEDLQSQQGKDAMRAEALGIVQDILMKEQEALAAKSEGDKGAAPVGKVEQVLFTNFVMQ
jgi:flagellar protein FliL